MGSVRQRHQSMADRGNVYAVSKGMRSVAGSTQLVLHDGRYYLLTARDCAFEKAQWEVGLWMEDGKYFETAGNGNLPLGLVGAVMLLPDAEADDE